MRRLSLILLCGLLAGCSSTTKPQAPTPDSDPVIKEEEPISQDTIVHFSGVGDNLIHEAVYQDADRLAGEMNDGLYDFTPMMEDVRSEIEASDLAFINQETILGGDDLGLSGYPTFNSPECLADQLPEFGFNMVNHATNHALDKWEVGVNNAIALWREHEDVVMAGIYDSWEDRQSIRVIEKNGIRFAFLAYVYGTNGIESYADYAIPYFDETLITQEVNAAKAVSDVVIVSAHWGNENQFEPNEFQLQYAQLFADLGVDVVIGTHPHVIQPVTWVTGSSGNNTLVVYSLGNFLGGMLDMYNNLSGMISFDFVKKADSDKITIENVKWIPLVIHYEGDAADIMNTRTNFKVIQLKHYSEEMAASHALNGYEGQTVTKEALSSRTHEVIGNIIPIEE